MMITSRIHVPNSLTIGKSYEVIDKYSFAVVVKDDSGVELEYNEFFFEETSEATTEPKKLTVFNEINTYKEKTDDQQLPTGKKFDQEKVRLELISSVALIELGKVLTFGAKKYDSNNWRGGLHWSRVLGAAMRHIVYFIGGQDKDPESGLSHLSHAFCCIMFLLEYEQTHKELDDRYAAPKKS